MFPAEASTLSQSHVRMGVKVAKTKRLAKNMHIAHSGTLKAH
jgi:hypothetical protein